MRSIHRATESLNRVSNSMITNSLSHICFKSVNIKGTKLKLQILTFCRSFRSLSTQIERLKFCSWLKCRTENCICSISPSNLLDTLWLVETCSEASYSRIIDNYDNQIKIDYHPVIKLTMWFQGDHSFAPPKKFLSLHSCAPSKI